MTKQKPPKMGTCNKCKRLREIYAKRLCRQCYRSLHPVKPTGGQCTACKTRDRYFGEVALHTVTSSPPGRPKQGLCKKHYMERWRKQQKAET